MNNIDALLDGETNNKVTLTVVEPNRSMSYNGQILLGVEGDHKAERIYFKAPRYIFMDKDVDLCSENIKIFIKFQNASNNTYIYTCDDKSTSDITGAVVVADDGEGNVSIDIAGGANASDNGDGGISLAAEEDTTEEVIKDEYIYFSWVLTKTVAESAGKVSFIVCIQNIGTDENGAEVVRNEWHSTPFTGEVQKGIPVNSATPEIITDPQTSIYQLKLEIQTVDLIVKQHDDAIKALSETVNNKADKTELDAKANQTDLNALTETVNSKANQTDLDALGETVNSKANQSELDALESAMNTKVNRSELELFEEVVIGKADKTDLNALEARVETLEAGGGSGSDSGDNTELSNRVTAAETEITNIKGDINTLETVVNAKASQNDVDILETDVSVLKGRVDTLEAGGATGEGEDNPVLLERLATAETDIGNLKTAVGNKADKTDLDAKADKTDLDAKADKSTVNTLQTSVEDLEGDITDLQTTKADKSDLDNHYTKAQTYSQIEIDNKLANVGSGSSKFKLITRETFMTTEDGLVKNYLDISDYVNSNYNELMFVMRAGEMTGDIVIGLGSDDASENTSDLVIKASTSGSVYLCITMNKTSDGYIAWRGGADFAWCDSADTYQYLKSCHSAGVQGNVTVAIYGR